MVYASKADQTAYSKAYYKAHKDRWAAYQEANRDRILGQRQAYRQAHKTEIAERWKAYHRAHAGERAAYREAHIEETYWGHIKRKYGLTQFGFQRTLERQRYACARCFGGLGEKTPHVDHDHDTGRVRGILCPPCNRKVHNVREIALTTAYLNAVSSTIDHYAEVEAPQNVSVPS